MGWRPLWRRRALSFEPDQHDPAICGQWAYLPAIPDGGTAVATFMAGFADDWSGLPAALRRGVLLLGAHFYEHRTAGAGDAGDIPVAISALLAPWRMLRLRLGSAS